MLGAMGRARNGKVGLRWEYFPNASAVLIDKIQKFHTNLVELGGEVGRFTPTSNTAACPLATVCSLTAVRCLLCVYVPLFVL